MMVEIAPPKMYHAGAGSGLLLAAVFAAGASAGAGASLAWSRWVRPWLRARQFWQAEDDSVKND